MLVWTVCAFRKSSMSEEEFHRYMSETHAPLVRDALARHGITRYTMVRRRHENPVSMVFPWQGSPLTAGLLLRRISLQKRELAWHRSWTHSSSRMRDMI